MVDSLVLLMAERRAAGQSRLPSERDLAAELSTSRGTLRKALARLEDDGLLERRVGRAGGIYLREVRPSLRADPVEPAAPFSIRRQLDRIQGVPALLGEQGHQSTTRVISAVEREAELAEASGLDINVGDPVTVLLRLRLADEEPLSLEQMILPSHRFPGLLEHSLGSIYELLEQHYGVAIAAVDETIKIGRATTNVAHLLQVKVDTPLFDVSRIGHDTEGRPVEMSHDLFNATITTLSTSVQTPGN
ncbi:GntR family transcriptional regulator [Propionibacteriaceae bacterium Y1923]